jgi:outer membrane protein assembly factor BamB
MKCPSFFVVFITVALCHSAAADPWPRFRGPNGTGISADKGIPVQWTDKDGILWKTAIPGLGNSSPVVWGDRVFLQSSTPDGHARMLLCVSTAEGKVLWQHTIKATPTRIHPKNTLASSTPATDGRAVYAVIWDGTQIGVYAYDMAGKPLWQRNLGGFASQHGPGMSPIICRDTVVVANDQDGVSTLVGLKAKTGEIVWQTAREAFRACYSTPFLLEGSGDSIDLIVASTAGLTSYEPATGKEKWKWKWVFSGMPLRTVGSAVCVDGLVFANSGDGNGDRHTVAVSIADGTPKSLWEKHRGFPYVPSMLAWHSYLFYVNDDGIAGCCVARSGEPLWNERLGGKVSASPILIDGKIYAINESGGVFVFAADSSFRLLGKSEVGEGVMATPAVADGRLYIRGREYLYCVGRAK